MKLAYPSSSAANICSYKSLFVLLSTVILICPNEGVMGQITYSELTGADLNAIQTSVPFLTIAPDGRSSGMGDVGVASTPDVSSQHWNAAKYAFMERKGGVALTYAPWLTNLIPGIKHFYLKGFYRINEKNAISTSLRYLSLGRIYFRSIGGAVSYNFYPREFALDAGYSRKFTNSFSGGIVLRYIHSVPASTQTASGQENITGSSIAGDMGLYYQNDIQIGGKDGQWALGLNMSNIGKPVSYSEDAPGTHIPTNLRMGGRFSLYFNKAHRISFHADINKLLVPSPGVYMEDSTVGALVLVRGKEAPGSVILGMFQSLYDAPGVRRSDGTYSAAKEEMYEIMFGLGAEYWYRKLFAIRTGYFHEHETKGNREYFTFGAGVRYKFLTFDLSYLLPVQGKSSPLYNTFRIALSAEFGKSAS